MRDSAVMLTVEFLDVAMNTVNKAAMSKGMSHFILVLYSNMLAVFFASFFLFHVLQNENRSTAYMVHSGKDFCA